MGAAVGDADLEHAEAATPEGREMPLVDLEVVAVLLEARARIVGVDERDEVVLGRRRLRLRRVRDDPFARGLAVVRAQVDEVEAAVQHVRRRGFCDARAARRGRRDGGAEEGHVLVDAVVPRHEEHLAFVELEVHVQLEEAAPLREARMGESEQGREEAAHLWLR